MDGVNYRHLMPIYSIIRYTYKNSSYFEYNDKTFDKSLGYAGGRVIYRLNGHGMERERRGQYIPNNAYNYHHTRSLMAVVYVYCLVYCLLHSIICC